MRFVYNPLSAGCFDYSTMGVSDIIVSMKVTILGSGTSHGVPVVGCSCPVCVSEDSRDKRTRSSVYIEGSGGERALIDAGPEFRLQAIGAGIKRLDAIFLTHAHADHVHGLDDVRSLTWDHSLPVYGNKGTVEEVRERFSYIWKETQRGGGKPKLELIAVNEPVQIGAIRFVPVPVKHGNLDILGWKVTDGSGKCFLYLTDTSSIPKSTQNRLLNSRPHDEQSRDSQNLHVVIIGGLRVKPHETHFTFEEAMDAAFGLGAGKIYLTHICHSHFHTEIEEICSDFMKNQRISTQLLKETEIYPAHDGLELYL